jgi:hypothetical protein
MSCAKTVRPEFIGHPLATEKSEWSDFTKINSNQQAHKVVLISCYYWLITACEK